MFSWVGTRVAIVFTDWTTGKEIRLIEHQGNKEECNTSKRKKSKRKIIGMAVIMQKVKITLVWEWKEKQRMNL